MTCEVGHEVWNAAVVDVSVGCFHSPVLWINCEIIFHVFVNIFLEVDSKFSVGANDDIGADSFASGNITVGIRDLEIGTVVNDLVSC